MSPADQPLTFANEAPPGAPTVDPEPWRVLIADDEEPVHHAMRLALNGFRFDGHHIQILSARSAAEARDVLAANRDIAVVLLDVIMEDHDAGLRLVRELREDLGMRLTRVVLLTGQPDEIPEQAVIQPFDVNDYKNKTELTQQRLHTTLTTALRAFRDLRGVEKLRASLERTVQSQMDELREKNRQLEATLERLKQLDGEKNTLLGIVAHDLKNPLSGMAGHIHLLLDEPDLRREERDESLRTLLQGVEGMTELVKRLLNANAIERGQIKTNPEPVDLADLCCTLAKAYTLKLLGKEQQMAVEVYTGSPIALVDRALTQQIVDNLYSNAMKFSPAGKAICVRVRDDESGAVCIEVCDHGPGLTAQDHARLFSRFTRLSAAPTAGEDATGLGLSIVKKLVELMRGTIECLSEPGHGATFVVRLPRPEIA